MIFNQSIAVTIKLCTTEDTARFAWACIKRPRDGHVQKDDANQLEGTQNQQPNNRGAAADMSFPGRSQTKEATVLRPCSPS